MHRIYPILLIIAIALGTPLLAESRYGSKFPLMKENAAPPKLILSDGSGYPISMTLSGEGKIRWLLGKDTGSYPYKAGLAGILNTEVELSKSLKIDYEMEIQQPDFSNGHTSQNPFYSRLTVHSIYDNSEYPFFDRISSKFGNLKKITIGQGLTLKGLEADGLQSQLFHQKLGGLSTTLTYIEKGYDTRGPIAALTLSDTQSENGIYVLSRIDKSAYFNSLGTLWGAFGRIPFPGFDIVYEGGTATHASREPGFAGMVSPRYTYKSANTLMQLSATARSYTSTYLQSFNQDINSSPNYFTKTYHSLIEEEDPYDNWRNLLITQAGTQDSASSLATNLRIDQRLTRSLWAFSQFEWVEEYYGQQIHTYHFITAGIKMAYSPDHAIYLAVSNKLLNGSAEGNAIDNNMPVLRQVPLFTTLGMVYRF
jgi:hypothetical protein